MDDERRRKIEAGKSKWAEFKKKKNRIAKSNSPPNAVLSRVNEKNCPVDPGGKSDNLVKPPSSERSELDNSSQFNKQAVLESKVLPIKNSSDEGSESTSSEVISTMDLSSQHDTSNNEPNVHTDNSVAVPERRLTLESNSSLDSLILERVNDESESSSGSDNSTITGVSSDSSKSDSTAEIGSTEKSLDVPHVHVHQKNQNDNRPDEEKALESIPSEEKEKDVLVEEILVSKESILGDIPFVPVEKFSLENSSEMKSYSGLEEESKNTLTTNPTIKDKVSSLSEDVNMSLPSLLTDAEDDPVPSSLNAGDMELSSLLEFYQIKIKKYQEAVKKKDSMISKLYSTLESTVNANEAANSSGNSQVDKLKEEINLLHLKMKETAELLKKQKQKNGNLEYESCSCQTEGIEICKCDTGVQVESSINSLLQNCNLEEISFFELFAKKFSTDSESLAQTIQTMKEFLLGHFSHVHIQELVTLLKNDISTQEFVPEKTEVISSENELQECEKIDSATILKKITSLNMVAKLIESLVSISTGNANDTFTDFSPSKFQSFFLRRMHSMETGDILPDMSESESVVSDINYAEVETPCSKPVVESTMSLEKLRRKNITEDFSIVTDFLQDEMERICSVLPTPSFGPQGDGLESQQEDDKEGTCGTVENSIESDHQKILLHKSKLETRLKNLKSLDKELQDFQQLPHQLSIDSDTMTMSDDNLMMEELPLSCISLLSLTDSEYKGDNITTDSEANFSRKVSLDMSRSMQERDFCIRCERNVDLLREKYENDIMNLKEQLENSYSSQKNELLESAKNLESEIRQLKTEKDSLSAELSKEIESSSESVRKFEQLKEVHHKELTELKMLQNKVCLEKEELGVRFKELEEKLAFSNLKVQEILDEKQQLKDEKQKWKDEKQKLKDEKAEIEINLQNQIADLIQDHEQDLENIRLENETKLNLEKKHLENNYKTSIEVMKKLHAEEIDDLKCQIKNEFEKREQNLINEHSKTINMIEAAHCDESAGYQKRIEILLEEKCELLTKTTQEYETILKKNHRALVILCKQLLSKIKVEKEKIANESLKSGGDFDISFSAFEELNNSLENGLVKFLNQKYFLNGGNEEFCPDDTEYLPIEMSYPVTEDDMPPKIEMKEFVDKSKKDEEKNAKRSRPESRDGSCLAASESSLDSGDDIYAIHTEINKLQEEFQKDINFYKDVNDQLHSEIKALKRQNQELEDQKENLEIQLQDKEKELVAKESMLSAMDAAAVKGGSQLSTTDIRSWQVQAAQTNSRLLHVLSDLVKTFLDIEHDINAHLLEYGLIPSRSGNLVQHDDDTGQSVGSREDFASLSLGDCQNLELTEDGPDLTPRAWDVFAAAGNYDTDLEGEDVVLGASRRLRLAVDHVLNLLSRALENQQNQDLKLLLKRNEELSHELQEESQGRDAVHMELVTAESTVRKLESEKQRLEDLNRDLRDDYEMLKRELNIERSKVSHLQQEKESAFDEIHTLKEQCQLLSSRLGDPERHENGKMLKSSGTCLHENPELLQENSRLSSEKQTVQKNLSKERQSFLDRLHQMEIALEELNAEKDDLVEKKCKEIRDLKAEMDAMEKQLQSNRKFIEVQAQEREQEREEFMNKINKMEEFIKEKERIQSTEAQLTREIESLEETLRERIEDHKNAMAKKDDVEKELRHSFDKIRDLRDVIDELEKQLDIKIRIESELRQKLSDVFESIPNQDKNSSLSDSTDSPRNMPQNGEAVEHLDNLKEQIASQSQEIEKMSQSQTLLHELRGQIHFLEAKVEQRVRQLESNFVSAASSPIQSGATSPSGSQDSESLQIPCEDGWEMSPRSIHWLEVRRLEEKIGRLVHIDEELMKKNKELEQQLKKIRSTFSECQHENTALQEKLSEQLLQISALKSHIDEQKHRCSTPQKTHSFSEKIEELREELEKQIENNKRLISDFQEAQSTVSALQDELLKKNEMIAIFQKCVESKNNDDEDSSEISTIEDLRNELAENIKVTNLAKKENKELRSDIEYLKTENKSLKSLLEKAEKEVETERAQVETLCEEMATLAENSKEGTMSFNNSNSNDTNASSLNEETQDHDSKQKSWGNCLKEKNLEILMLKATITKLESSLRSAEKQLEYEKKKLEQDFNTVQDMMTQKERELETLQEETDDQIKLEAEIESLERKLSDQKNVESELREEIEELGNQLKLSKSIKDEIENKDLCIKNLKETHMKEIDSLNKQIAVLKKFSASSENTESIEELVDKILEAAKTFKLPETNNEAFQEVIIHLLRSSIESVVKHMKQDYEEQITSINKTWQEKVNEEITNKQNSFKREKENMQKTFQKEREKISAEKDAFWQEKIKVIELKLKKEQTKCKKLSDTAKISKDELQAMHTSEINSVKQNLEAALEEKISLGNIIKDLSTEIDRLTQSQNEQKNKFSKEYETKLSAISKTIEESFESEKQKIIASYQQRVDQLQKELDQKLEQEKITELKHKEELTAVYKYFETRFTSEMKKVKDSQSEDLQKLKNDNEKILEDKLRNIKEEYAASVAEERKQVLQKHLHEMEQLQQKFEEEKKQLLEMKDKAVKEATDVLEKKFKDNLTEIQKNLPSSSHTKLSEEQKKWEEEKLKLISSHRKELFALKQELKTKYEKQLQAQTAAHMAEIKRLEETYNMKVEEVNDLIKEARRAASKTGYSETGSNRTTTPSSDVTSSDEACSSCQEDMLSVNKHILVDKIHQDGKRVLSLIESSAQPFASVKEAHLWLEERKWIINKLKVIASVTSNVNLKIIVSDLVDEVQKFRKNFEKALEENSELQQKCDDLEQQINIQYSKLCDVSMQLKKQIASNSELESLLSVKTFELTDLKRKLADMSRLAEKEIFTPNSGSTGSSSYEIGVLRSADEPRSAEKFSMFLPEIANTPPSSIRTPSNKVSVIQDMTFPKYVTPSLRSTQNSSPTDVIDASKIQMSEVKDRLMTVLSKGIDSTDEQLHGLYWAYRRSQSYNKALIYQKKYLLMLLRGFQVTENVTLAWLKHMDNAQLASPANDTTFSDPPLQPRSRFRTLAFVIIAVQRMKFYVRRWRLLARIPPSQVISMEIQSVFQNCFSLSPALSPGSYHLSSHSLASAPVFGTERDYKNVHMSASLRAENKSKNSTNPDKSQLIEYVHRLEILQKQLGLDSLR